MPMQLKKIERANPQNRAEKKWYLIKDVGRIVTLDTIADEIQGRSAMTKGDILNVLSNLVQIIPQHLKNGDSVRLGSFGSLRVTVSSEGAGTADELTGKHAKGVRVGFTPGVEFKKEMSSVTFTVK